MTSLVLLTTLLGQGVFSGFSLKIDNHDRELFKKFLDLLPSNSRSIKFLGEHDLGDSFPRKDLDQLSYFVNYWDNAEHEFHNKLLEKKRTELITLTKNFLHNLSRSVFSVRGGYLSMELRDMEDRLDKLETRDKLNEDATKIFNVHQQLIQLGNRRLTR
ncbi:MAG: hypothetical protein KME44_07990 [Candidatus Thiodiazotropha sp. (ex Lucina pensylvanica)]|nr:hypothetical protein [Candidatus Thiodiazotropha sp. (ex Lucina pensylvanica)]